MTSLPEIEGVDELVEIGRGGFAVVYRGTEPRYGRHVAVKLLTSELDSDAAARFARELRAMGTVTGHPNIVTVFRDGHLATGQPYLVMEFLAGGSLKDRIQAHGAMGWREAAETGAKLAMALSAAHDVGIIHRDIKPDNVFRSADGDPKLGDFGIARLDGGFETRTGTISASLAHAPIEVIEGHAGDVTSDIYSLASTIYTMVVGRPPFGSPRDVSVVTLLGLIANQPAPELQLEPEAEQFRSVIRAALRKDRAERPQTAREFAERLRQSLGPLAEPVQADLNVRSSPVSTPHPPAKEIDVAVPAAVSAPRSRRLAKWSLLVAGALAVAAIAAFALLRDNDPKTPSIVALAPGQVQANPFVTTNSGFADVLDPDLTPLTLPDNGSAISTVRGDAPGLYSASPADDPCDRQTLAKELDGDLERLQTWAFAAATTPSNMTIFIDQLASVFTKHAVLVEIVGYSPETNDIVRRAAILEGGTSVLVDQFGVPRIRCIDGSPLNLPSSSEGLDRPSDVISIVPGARMTSLDVDDLDAPGTFLLPIGVGSTSPAVDDSSDDPEASAPPTSVAVAPVAQPLPTVSFGTQERISVPAGSVTVDLGSDRMSFLLSDPHQVLSQEAHLLVYFDNPNIEVDIFRPFATNLRFELGSVDDVVTYLQTDSRFGRTSELQTSTVNGFFTRTFQIEPESFLAFVTTPTVEEGIGWVTPPLLRLWLIEAPNGPVIVTAESLDEDLVAFDEATAVALEILTSMDFDGE